MTSEGFSRAVNVSRETLDRLIIYRDLLTKWNRAINLVSPKSLQDLWRRHFLDSVQLLPYLPSGPDRGPSVIIDLGSGAGFPGMVLAIAGGGPTALVEEIHLVESDGRKCAFLQEVARATEAPVRIHNCRIEGVETFPVDVVSARALAPLPKLLEYGERFFQAPRGLAPVRGLFLKGKGVDQELTDSQKVWDFTVKRHKSATDPTGTILQVELRSPTE
ncbi:MAG: 16S rRNA (guanine(527)-N(7))-methyltransferase RsmG [Pseudomonadota bacterium]